VAGLTNNQNKTVAFVEKAFFQEIDNRGERSVLRHRICLLRRSLGMHRGLPSGQRSPAAAHDRTNVWCKRVLAIVPGSLKVKTHCLVLRAQQLGQVRSRSHCFKRVFNPPHPQLAPDVNTPIVSVDDGQWLRGGRWMRGSAANATSV
jgi:hypothetical protein